MRVVRFFIHPHIHNNPAPFTFNTTTSWIVLLCAHVCERMWKTSTEKTRRRYFVWYVRCVCALCTPNDPNRNKCQINDYILRLSWDFHPYIHFPAVSHQTHDFFISIMISVDCNKKTRINFIADYTELWIVFACNIWYTREMLFSDLLNALHPRAFRCMKACMQRQTCTCPRLKFHYYISRVSKGHVEILGMRLGLIITIPGARCSLKRNLPPQIR